MIVGLITLKSFLAIVLRKFANQTFYHKIEYNFEYFFQAYNGAERVLCGFFQKMTLHLTTVGKHHIKAYKPH